MFQKKFRLKNAVLFEELIFPQDSYEKDKKGSKRPAVQGKRVEYTSSFEKVSKTDLENLKSGLEVVSTNCPLLGLLTDNNCIPSEYDENKLPSRKQNIAISVSKSKFEITDDNEQSKAFIQKKLIIDNAACFEMKKIHGHRAKVQNGTISANIG